MLMLHYFCSLDRINPLSLVEIILYVARQMTGKSYMKLKYFFHYIIYFSLNIKGGIKWFSFPDPKDAITFLEKTKEKVS